MIPLIAALGHPAAWTPVEESNGTGCLVFEHTQGLIIRVLAREERWRVLHDGDVLVPNLHRSPRPVSGDAFLHDLDLAFGPLARARLDLAHRKVVLALVALGVRGRVRMSRYDTFGRYLLSHVCPQTNMDLCMKVPQELTAALLACQHVLSPSAATGDLSTTNEVLLDLPATAHGVLEFLQKVQDNGTFQSA